MDAGPVTGKRDAVFMDKAALHGWGNGRGTEYLLEKLFVIKREFIPGNSFPSHNFCNVRMAVRKFFSFSRFIGRLSVFISGEKIFSGGFLELFILEPEAVNKIIIRTKRRQGVRGAANKKSQQGVGVKLFHPGGNACKTLMQHKNQGTQDLRLVDSRTNWQVVQ